MQMIPNGVAQKACTDPAILDAKHPQGLKRLRDVRLPCKKRGDIIGLQHKLKIPVSGL